MAVTDKRSRLLKKAARKQKQAQKRKKLQSMLREQK